MGCLVLGFQRAGFLTWTLTASNFNALQSHSNAGKKVIDTQCTFVLFSGMFACTEPRSATRKSRSPLLAPLPFTPSSHSNLFFSEVCALFSLTAVSQPFVYQSLRHSFHRDRGAHPSSQELCALFAACSSPLPMFQRSDFPTFRRSHVPTLFQPSFVFNRFHTLSFSVSCNSCICHSYENNRGVPKQFPFWNSSDSSTFGLLDSSTFGLLGSSTFGLLGSSTLGLLGSSTLGLFDSSTLPTLQLLDSQTLRRSDVPTCGRSDLPTFPDLFAWPSIALAPCVHFGTVFPRVAPENGMVMVAYQAQRTRHSRNQQSRSPENTWN